MFTQHQNTTRTLATLVLFTLAGFAANARADFQVGGNDPYVNDNDILVFDDDNAVTSFIHGAIEGLTPADLGGDETEDDIIDIALELATDQIGFDSLAAQLINVQSGAAGEATLNVDAHRVTDWVQQRLLNTELEVQVGASIFKVMGDSIVEITDGDAVTLAWLRDIQQTRRNLQAQTPGGGDDDVSWLSGSASNVTVHEWRPRATVEVWGDSGLPQFLSTPVRVGHAMEYEAAGADDTPQNLSTPARQGRYMEVDQLGADDTPQDLSTPSQGGRQMEYEAAGANDLPSNE